MSEENRRFYTVKGKGVKMGCFGYLCRGCGTPINGDCFSGGEKCILIHVRHGIELARAEGHYDEYGGVVEQCGLPEHERFRGNCDGLNGHGEICISEIHFEDSYLQLSEKRVYRNQELTYFEFALLFRAEIELIDPFQHSKYSKIDAGRRKEVHDKFRLDPDGAAKLARTYLWEYLDAIGVYEAEFARLGCPKREKYSGIVAWHSLCYRKASEEQRATLVPSDSDPNQSWGPVRKKYS